MGGKVTVLRKGWVVTDSISGTPTVGQVAYLNVGATGGLISGGDNADFLGSGIGSLAVGRFLSVKDEDGYAKVEINL